MHDTWLELTAAEVHQRDLIRDAEYAINEGGATSIEPDGRLFFVCSTAEKGTARFTVRGQGEPGHAFYFVASGHLRVYATDGLGRTLEATGRCINRFANQAKTTSLRISWLIQGCAGAA